MLSNIRFPHKFIILFFIIRFIFPNLSLAQNDSLNKVSFKVNDIFIIGNTTTKNSVILRELTFAKGDLIDSLALKQKLQRSKENIYNISLFNSVDVVYFSTGSNEINITIILKERWYLWPVPIFEIHERNFNVWWQTKNFNRAVYGGYLVYNNFRGRNETLQLSTRQGYIQRYELKYDIPFINKQQKIGIGFSGGYNTNHEVAYSLKDNQSVYFKNDSLTAFKEFYAEARMTKRDGLYNTQTVYINYKNDKINDTVVSLNKDYFLNASTTQQCISVSYQFEQDYRDIKVYPLKGYYFNFMLQHVGLIQKNLNISYLRAAYKKYWKLTDKFYLETGINGRYSFQKSQPFFLQSALGYGTDYVRGYELYVINGQNFGLLKTELKWQLFYPKVIHIPYIPAEKFNSIPMALYLTAFGDFGYAQDRLYAAGNPLSNTLLPGAGIGIDYVTYYDIVWRFEYSINKMNQCGFYLHFSAPI